MKAGWLQSRLGDVCRFDKNQGVHSDLPYVGLEHIEPDTAQFIGSLEPTNVKSSTFKFTSKHILYGRLRPYLNKVLTPDFDGHCSTEIFPIVPAPELMREYLRYWLQSTEIVTKINATCTGARMPRADMNEVLNFNIPLPSLPEQQRIVAILDEAFEAIAAARTNAEQNRQNARALFESYLQSAFSQRGEGWVEKPLGEIADLLDCLHKTPTYAETGFPMVRVTDVKPGFLDLSKTRKVDEQTYISFSKGRTPRVGDIVFSRVGSCGVSALVNSDEPFCLGQNTMFILPKMNSVLLYHFLNSPNAKEQFEKFIEGTTQPTISMKSIRQVVVPIAPPAEHQSLVDNINALRDETQRLESLYQRKIAALDELKQSLLQQAFSGQL